MQRPTIKRRNINATFPQAVITAHDGFLYVSYTKLNAVLIEGFKEKGVGKYFFRKGKIGVWKDQVSKDIIKPLENLFGKEMVELGYL